MNLAMYCRVSTEGKGQDTANQIAELRRYAAAANDTITHEYIDHASGKSGDRTQFKAMLADASKRKFEAVLVWALDRFTREGIEETFAYVRRLKENGVDFISYSEPYFRTTGPTGELMLSIAAWIAKQERIRISERTKAGLARVKAAGKRLGRVPVGVDPRKLEALRLSGCSISEIAADMQLSRGVVQRALEAAGLNGPRPARTLERAEQAAAEPEQMRAPATDRTNAAESQPQTVAAIVQEIQAPLSSVPDRWDQV